MWKLLVWVPMVLALTAKLSSADDSETIQASVESISEADLGRPYTAKFLPVTGKDGRSLFPSAKGPRKSQVNTWAAGFIDVDDTRILQANASAWGLSEVALSGGSRSRYLVYRVRVVEHTLEIDDTSEPRSLEPGSTAAYYVRKIHFGRIYQIVISGSQEALTGRVAVGIKALGSQFGAEHVRRQYKLSVSHSGKGLKPTSDALFATSTDEIKAAYKDKDMGPAVPILVEYRRIPGTKLDEPERIDWAPPTTAAPKAQVRFLKVMANNSDWTAAGVSASSRDLVGGFALGKVEFSSWSPKAEADATGSGGLELRIGTTLSPAGKSWITAPSNAAGEVKLRVRDNNHTDNSGGYDVILFIIPETLLKSGECQKQEADGTYTDC